VGTVVEIWERNSVELPATNATISFVVFLYINSLGQFLRKEDPVKIGVKARGSVLRFGSWLAGRCRGRLMGMSIQLTSHIIEASERHWAKSIKSHALS
jgi:hypothetical protein